VTVTQTNKALYAYDPSTGGLYPDAPSVTVDQTTNLTNQVVHVTWQNFTPSSTLSGNPGYVSGGTRYAVGVFECRGTDPTISPYTDQENSGSGTNVETDCYRWTTASYLDATDGQANAVDTFTAADGTGEAYVQIETAEENAFLGCNSTTPCSIVVVPMFGGPVSDKYSAKKCAVHTKDGGNNQQALDSFIGDACSWADRLTVPLSFAPTSASCPAATAQFTSGGSPMLGRAIAQWRPGWCAGDLPLSFQYSGSLSEDEARSQFLEPATALTKPLDVAFTTEPVSADEASSRAFTYAPIANTAVSIAFVIDDDTTGKQLTTLKLNARLVAKLLTQSYSLRWNNCSAGLVQSATCDPGTYGNPQTILQDPEFRALNPSWADLAVGQSPTQQLGTFLPTVVEGNSDLIYALTRWVASDPTAAAFLAGAKDPWGMHVNTYYKNPGWPTSSLTVSDPGWSHASTPDGSNGYCPGNGTSQNSWGPISGLDNVASTLLGGQSSAYDVTPTLNVPCSYPKVAPETTGTRFLLAVVDQGHASAFQFPTAELENAAGDFVAPTTASIAAGVANQTTNPDGVTQQENLTAKDAAAYPLTVTDYAMVPTCALSSSTVQGVTDLLTLVGGSGQTNGTAPGQLNPGYVPLTAAQLVKTNTARTEVAAQKICATTAGGVPVSADPSGVPGGVSSSAATGGASASATAAAAAAEAQAIALRHAQAAANVTSEGHKYGVGPGHLDILLPALILGVVLLFGGGPAVYLLAGKETVGRLRRLRLVGLLGFIGRLRP
jgi:hypothetical protein